MTTESTRGARFKADVLAAYDLRPDELAVLDEIAKTLDILDDPGLAITEQRQQRLVLSRLLGLLALQDEAAPRPSMSGKSVRARRASEARWRREATA
jgi:hypothetical protein